MRLAPFLLRACCCAALLHGAAAQAAAVTYTLQARFDGTASGDATALVSAGQSLFSGQTLSWRFTLETGTPGVPAPSGSGTAYHQALHSTSASIAGFTPLASACPPGVPDFICAVRVVDGSGIPGSGADQVSLFPQIMTSVALASALGETRTVSMQINTFLLDVSGSFLDDEALDFDLGAAPLGALHGSLSLFVFDSATAAFQRADFGLHIEHIDTGDATSVPEPGTAALVALGAALGLRRFRRR
jgi:hypothetical protein